ncbi:prohead protease/major capsid protein fusion protein [Rubellimicrobium aerolatum]|uniref:Prohead protease/major capsid protein fusion protein n=1 Tax=Rubellimicrobium aerolatum TaxID=490979 RepID=A0ABW0SFQ9_9RHOB|nr:prohead protease/major capsid protein fusion protein [Rubellimicrobium aerolatum]MBP1806467.1 hypothetical protein [Rubellimicrobium aerolatum]
MPQRNALLPLLGRAAEVRPASIDAEARTIEVVWTTGATVQRARWEGWDERVEYDEELIVSGNAVRLDRLNAGAPFLDSHSSWSLGSVLGSVVPGSVRIEGSLGHATVRLTEAADAADAVQRIMEGSVRFVSVGYRVHRYEITNREGQRELWRAVDWEPFEISAVAMPADPGAHVRSGEASRDALAPCVLTRKDTPAAPAAQRERTTMENEDQAAPGTETRTVPTPPGSPQATSADAIRAEERRRVSEISQLCRRHGAPETLADTLIGEGATLDAARSAILDHLAGSDPAGRVVEPVPAQARSQGATETAFRDAVASALMHRHNPSGQQLPEGAREFRGLSLLELAREVLGRRGVSTRGMSKMEVAASAFTMRSAGYHSASDFPTILGNVANRTLRAAYESTPRTFQAWARRATIADFRPVTRAQLGGAPDLLKVNENGEFKYGTMGEGKAVYGLATFGRIFPITRQALINDELDAFTRMPEAWGASAADLESDIVYGILLANAAMADGKALFHADHGNVGTGATINETALAAAYRDFGKQKGLEGRLISILPKFILVPPGQRSVEARKQVTATTPSSTAEVNTFSGRLQVVEEARLIPAAGQDPWYLAADPARIDTVEYAYLDGNEGVHTETRAGFEVDGMEFKARHDFAAAAIDHRGLYRNPGAAA